MDNARAVITQDGDFIVVSFYGIPVYTNGGSGSFKFEHENLALMVAMPLSAQLVRGKNGETLDATSLARDWAQFMDAEK